MLSELVQMGLMSEAHKHNLNRNRVQLMKNVHCLPGVFEFLRQDYTLTEEMQEEIQVTFLHLVNVYCTVICINRVKFVLLQIVDTVCTSSKSDTVTHVWLASLLQLSQVTSVKFQFCQSSKSPNLSMTSVSSSTANCHS